MAQPTYSLKITYGGVTTDLSRYFTHDGGMGMNQITQNFGRNGDTATFILMDEHPTTSLNFYVPQLAQVNLTDTSINRVIFAGVVTDPIFRWVSPTLAEWNLTCVDYTLYAGNKIVNGDYVNQPADTILLDLVKQANCGLNAATIAQGGHVYPGPIIPHLSVRYETLQTALTNLAAVAGIVIPYGWRVDENRNIWFYNQLQAPPSGVSFTDVLSGSPTTSRCYINVSSMFQYEWDGSSLRNRCFVQGATNSVTAKSTDAPTDKWVGDGVTTSWRLTHDLTSGSTSFILTINGRQYTVGASGSTAPFIVTQDSNGAWWLQAQGAAPTRGSVLRFWYTYDIPVVAQADDVASQQLIGGPNGGVYETFISDTTLTTAASAFQLGLSEIREYSKVMERIQIYTAEGWPGHVLAGDVVNMNLSMVPDANRGYALGINDTFVVVNSTISFTTNGYRQYWLTAERA